MDMNVCERCKTSFKDGASFCYSILGVEKCPSCGYYSIESILKIDDEEIMFDTDIRLATMKILFLFYDLLSTETKDDIKKAWDVALAIKDQEMIRMFGDNNELR